MTSSFISDDLVNHSVFGLGIVSACIPPNKIELTFIKGPKILICKPISTAETTAPTTKKKKKIVRKSPTPIQ